MIRTITPIFSIIIALVVFFFYTKPMFAEIKKVDGEREEYQVAVSKAKELNDELNTKLEQTRSYSTEDIVRLDALVPTEIDEVRILADLNAIAQRHNMLFGNVSVSNSDSEKSNAASAGAPEATQSQKITYTDIANTEIQFGLIGTYEQFKSLLADIERSLVMMEVTNITFSVGEGDLQQYDVTVRVFALPPIE